MSEFIAAIKSDLLDRRLLPIVALVAIAVVAALAYALSGGSSAPSEPPAGGSGAVSTTPLGVSVTQAPSTAASEAVAETTSGSALQYGGVVRDPFTPLPSAASKSAGSTAGASTSPKTSSSTKTSSSESSGSSKSSGGTSSTPSKPSKPENRQETVYQVAVLFGEVPAGTSPASAQLKPYDKLTRQQPLPSAQRPLIVLRGVTTGGKDATFTLVGEAILHGEGVCLPSPTQCQTVELAPGKSEELEYLPPSGAAVTYRLQLVDITSGKASAANAHEAGVARRARARVALASPHA